MDKHNLKSAFCKWIEPISFKKLPTHLQEQIKQANAYVKKFDFHSFLEVMLHAVSSQKTSLRDIEAALFDPAFQEELGFESLSHSQLSRTLRRIDPAVLEELFLFLVSLVHQKEKPGHQPKAFIIDSTTFSLNKTRYPWAEFRTTKSGVKLHLKLAYIGEGDVYPEKLTMTNANVHDVNQLEILGDQKHTTYIFDRGYLDFELFDQLANEDHFFVSRIKKNTKTFLLNEYEVAPESTVLKDKMVALGGSQGYLTDPYRLVEVKDRKGNFLRLITNRFDLSAEEISQLYRSRWAIELFFKHLKQQTSIKKFYSQDEDGLENQIYLVLIAQLLTYLIKMEMNSPLSSLTIMRYLLASLWQESEKWLHYIRGKPKDK